MESIADLIRGAVDITNGDESQLATPTGCRIPALNFPRVAGSF